MLRRLVELAGFVLFLPVAILMAVLSYFDFYHSDRPLPMRKF